MNLSDFWDYVDKSAGENACWPWLRAINKNGYGSVWIDKKCVTASRIAYELTFGPIPKGDGYHGLVVMHSCDNRPCCNPKHLSLGTQRDNNKDRDEKGRVKRRCRGEENHNSRFTQNDVFEIRKMIKDGQSFQSVASLYGCSKSAIAHIHYGRVWNWVPNTPLGQAALKREFE